jgi:hypothetical protein
MIEMRGAGRAHSFSKRGPNLLVYEIRLTNESKTPLAVQRLELRDAD